jgi:hypothetical protein
MSAGIDALVLAYGKGRQKDWALRSALLDAARHPQGGTYLKLGDSSALENDPNREKADGKFIVRFGFLYRVPKTEVDILIDEKTLKITVEEPRPDFGFGWDEVEKSVGDWLIARKKEGNLFLQTNLNSECFKIK